MSSNKTFLNAIRTAISSAVNKVSERLATDISKAQTTGNTAQTLANRAQAAANTAQAAANTAQAAANTAQETANEAKKIMYADGNLIDISAEISIMKYFDNRSLNVACCPFATTIGSYAFRGAVNLDKIVCPAAILIEEDAFSYCYKLTTVEFPLATSLGEVSLQSCWKLMSIDLPAVTSLGARAFSSCTLLKTVILRNAAASCTIGTAVFENTPIAAGNGYVYVPTALLESYKADENWSTYASQFRTLEEYTVDGTITGELDPSKI